MKAYFDANIYVSYLLGQKNCDKIDRIFKAGSDCMFSIVMSKTTAIEVAVACDGKGMILLQSHIDMFASKGKLEVLGINAVDDGLAHDLDDKTGHKFGLNDCRHCILAQKYSDIFVTDDRQLAGVSSPLVKTLSACEFLSEL